MNIRPLKWKTLGMFTLKKEEENQKQLLLLRKQKNQMKNSSLKKKVLMVMRIKQFILPKQRKEAIKIAMMMKMKSMEMEMNLMMTMMERNSWRRKYQGIPLRRNQRVARREAGNQKVKLKKMLKKLTKKLQLWLVLLRLELLKHLSMKRMMRRKKLKVLLHYQMVRE